jgi:UDP-N-acetylmuramate-alanine ligase
MATIRVRSALPSKRSKKNIETKNFLSFFSRTSTHELVNSCEEFATSVWSGADQLVIPDIYFSRDKKEDVEWMTTEKLVTEISKNQPKVQNGNGLENTAKLIAEYDEKHQNSSVILLI